MGWVGWVGGEGWGGVGGAGHKKQPTRMFMLNKHKTRAKESAHQLTSGNAAPTGHAPTQPALQAPHTRTPRTYQVHPQPRVAALGVVARTPRRGHHHRQRQRRPRRPIKAVVHCRRQRHDGLCGDSQAAAQAGHRADSDAQCRGVGAGHSGVQVERAHASPARQRVQQREVGLQRLAQRQASSTEALQWHRGWGPRGTVSKPGAFTPGHSAAQQGAGGGGGTRTASELQCRGIPSTTAPHHNAHHTRRLQAQGRHCTRRYATLQHWRCCTHTPAPRWGSTQTHNVGP